MAVHGITSSSLRGKSVCRCDGDAAADLYPDADHAHADGHHHTDADGHTDPIPHAADTVSQYHANSYSDTESTDCDTTSAGQP